VIGDCRSCCSPAAAHGYISLRDRLRLRPPLAWLNGTIYSVFTYVGQKQA